MFRLISYQVIAVQTTLKPDLDGNKRMLYAISNWSHAVKGMHGMKMLLNITPIEYIINTTIHVNKHGLLDKSW